MSILHYYLLRYHVYDRWHIPSEASFRKKLLGKRNLPSEFGFGLGLGYGILGMGIGKRVTDGWKPFILRYSRYLSYRISLGSCRYGAAAALDIDIIVLSRTYNILYFIIATLSFIPHAPYPNSGISRVLATCS